MKLKKNLYFKGDLLYRIFRYSALIESIARLDFLLFARSGLDFPFFKIRLTLDDFRKKVLSHGKWALITINRCNILVKGRLC